jgi:hypothetical protein
MAVEIPYTSPSMWSDAFNCPHCHAFSSQRWGKINLIVGSSNFGQSDEFVLCRCARCEKFSIWVGQRLLFPPARKVPPANSDLPQDIIRDYEEASEILDRSPRGAAAILRLCIQNLCKLLGEPGANINEDIASLVRKGLSPKVQQALDIVRVVGNNAVHPGQLDLRDDIDTSEKLFGLLNLITDTMITQPKHINEMFNKVVPDSQKSAIAKRDGT